jgi:adhesin/invasin
MTTLTVRSRDVYGNALSGGGGVVVVAISGANPDTAMVTDNNNGTYTATYTPAAAGIDNLTITLNGVAISGSPYTSIVTGDADPTKSTGTIPATGTAGNQTSLLITARDVNSNPLSVGGATVAIAITGANMSSPTVIDNGDGTYSALYTPTKVGTDNVAVTLNGGAISGSPFASVVGPGTVDPSRSTAIVPGAGAVGASTQIVVSARDAFDNALVTGGAAVVVTVTGANSVSPIVVDNSDGTYSTSYTPGTTGTDNIAITLNGEPVSGSPFTSILGIGDADASQTTATVAVSVSAGTNNAITVTSRDLMGDPLAAGGEIVLVVIAGANPSTPSVTDNDDGTYTASYAPVVLGADTITVTLNGLPIGNSPLTTSVAPGPLDPASSTAVVPNGTVGLQTSLSIQARDQFSNPVPDGGSTVSATITGANPGPIAVTDNSDGTYSANYTPANPGIDMVAITMDGTAVSGSPFTSTVSTGTVDPAQTTATVAASLAAGEHSAIVVTARDASGNQLTVGGATVVVSVSGANSTTPVVTDVGDGTYTASYAPTVAGTDNVAITINGTPIGGSPFTSFINPAEVDAASSSASVPANGAAGLTTSITITARDSLGNSQIAGGATVVVNVTGANTVMPSVTDNGDGTYAASYTPTVAGTDVIAITVNGGSVAGSPFTSVIGSGAAVASTTTADVPETTGAGTIVAITIQGRDAIGNPVGTGGDIVNVAVSGANSAMPVVTDNADGTYSATYTPTVLGTDNVAITLNGMPISGSPFTTTVNPGPPDATRTTATLPLNTSAGIEVPIAIQARDALGNPVGSGGSTVVVNVTGANLATPAVTDNGDGTYSASYTPTIPGMDGVTITLDGTGIVGSPFTVNVSVGVADPSQSTAVVPAAVTAGTVVTIPVTTRDASGNEVQTGGQTVVIAVTGANTATPTVFDLGNGRYSASYIPTTAGEDNVSITMNGTPIKDSPFTTTVNADVVDPRESTAEVGPGMAGQPTPITVQARDAHGNPVPAAGLSVVLTVTGANTASPTVTNNGDGTYSATYTPTVAGTDNISVTTNGTAASLNPFPSVVTPGPAEPIQSTATVPAGTSGGVTQISVQARDAFGNPLSTGGQTVVVTVTGANSASPNVTDLGTGIYTASYTPATAGTDNVSITMNGTPVNGSPFTSIVGAGTASPAQSTADVPAGVAGSSTTIVVTARDASGNPLTTGGAGVSIVISGANSSSPFVNDNGNGTYTTFYNPQVTGTDIVNITMNGVPIGGSPYTSTVSAGAVDGARSTATAPATIVAGNVSTVNIQARDGNGNAVTTGGATVVVSVTGANTASPSVTDNGNGTYQTTYTPTVAGFDNVLITINGVELNSSPLSTTVNPGSISPGSSTANVPASAIAGTVITYTITARDQFGNALSSGGHNVVVSITGANTATPFVNDNLNGRYNASYIPSATGTDNVVITLNGVNISGSPFTTTINPGSFDPSESTATVPAGTAGSATVISIQARDNFGNPVQASGQAVVVSVTGANTAAPPVTDNGNGTYTASYTPTTSGTDNIAITMNTVPILFSPYTSVVSAGPVNASQSTATVPNGTAGSPTVMTVQARDQFGNPLATGGANVNVSVSGANTANPNVTDVANGTYTATYTPTNSGTDIVAITLNGSPISGSPFSRTVGAGNVDPTQSTATVPATGTAGAVTNLSIQARDSNGNPLTTGGATVVITVTGANNRNPVPTDLGNGTYTSSYTPTVTGTDNVIISINGTAISGSPYASVVGAGGASGAQSTATVPGTTTAGNAANISVQARDANGNALTTGGASVVVNVIGANTASPTVTDNNNGTYSASYTPTVSGQDNIEITLGGVEISGSSFGNQINPGPVNAAASTSNVPASATAGDLVTYTVTARDQFGNAIGSGSHTVVVTITGANPATPTVSNQGNGTYSAFYTPSVVGTDNVVITLNGGAISGSPYATTINPGTLNPSMSTATVPATGTTGVATAITIQGRDGEGNPVTIGGGTVVITVTGANGASPAVTDNGNGTYSASYTPAVAGEDTIAIMINGVGITGSPFASMVSVP